MKFEKRLVSTLEAIKLSPGVKISKATPNSNVYRYIKASVASTLDYINDTLAERVNAAPSSPPPPPEDYLTQISNAANNIVSGTTPAAVAAQRHSALKEKQMKTKKETSDQSDKALSTATKMSVAVAGLATFQHVILQ